MRKFLVKMFMAVALAIAPMAAYANDVCLTPSQVIANIEEMEKAGNFDATIYNFTDRDAEAVRAWAADEGDVPLEDVVPFDQVILAAHPTDPNVFSILFKNGCKIGGGIINKAALDKLLIFLGGV